MGTPSISLITAGARAPRRALYLPTNQRIPNLIKSRGKNQTGAQRQSDEGEEKEETRRKLTDVPDPRDTNVTTGNTLHLTEAPISIGRDDGGNKLGDEESNEQGSRRSFCEEPAVGTCNEDLVAKPSVSAHASRL